MSCTRPRSLIVLIACVLALSIAQADSLNCRWIGDCATQDYAWGVAVAGNHAYVADYELGLSVINVSDPAHPLTVGFCDLPSVALDVAVAGSYAYVADAFRGLRVIDVSDPANPQEAGYCDTSGWAVGVAVAGSYAYVADYDSGLRIIDVSDPAHPQEAGYCDTLGGPMDVVVAGSYAYVADFSGLRVIDVSDPAHPLETGHYDTPGNAQGVAMAGHYAYVADRDAGLRVIDVSDPAYPQEIGYHDTPARAQDVAVAGNYAYVADFNYGLQIYEFLGSPALKEWSVLVFMNGDNNLEGAAIDDINEMERAVSPDLYNLVVQLDRIPGYDNSNGDWTDTRRYLITPDASQDRTIRSAFLESEGEVNMGDGRSLVDFVRWAEPRYPAKKYCIICWDHGSGWHRYDPPELSFSDDETDHDAIKVAGENREYNRALADIRAVLGRNIDLFCFDACLMGMAEVEHESKDFVDCLVHSEYMIPYSGYPYTDMLAWLNAHPTAAAKEFAAAIVQRYCDSYRPGGSQAGHGSVTLSATDLSPQFSAFVTRLNTFASELIKAGGRNRAEIALARNQSQHFTFMDDPAYQNENMDLKHFSSLISSDVRLPASLRNAAGSPLTMFPSVVSYADRYSDPQDSSVENSNGIAIHYPLFFPEAEYANLSLSTNTLWDEFQAYATQLPQRGILTYQDNTKGSRVAWGTVRLGVKLKNIGGLAAHNISARLSVDDRCVSLLQDTSSLPDCLSESVAMSRSDFILRISDTAELGRRIPLFLATTSGMDDTASTSFSVVVDTSHVDVGDWCPSAFFEEAVLYPSTPNPFRSHTMIRYALPQTTRASLAVYDATGRLRRTLVDGRRKSGIYCAAWDAKDERRRTLPEGVYFVRLETAGGRLTQKVVLTK